MRHCFPVKCYVDIDIMSVIVILGVPLGESLLDLNKVVSVCVFDFSKYVNVLRVMVKWFWLTCNSICGHVFFTVLNFIHNFIN